MFAPPVMQLLDGDRLHLSHGPIDIVLRAWGEPAAVRAAYAAAWTRFQPILPALCDELRLLRRPMDELMRMGRATLVDTGTFPKRSRVEPPLTLTLSP